jgi:hypothetical protein
MDTMPLEERRIRGRFGVRCRLVGAVRGWKVEMMFDIGARGVGAQT